MQELFDALNNYRQPEFNPSYYIKIQGNEIVCLANSEETGTVKIDKETYLMLMRQGHQNFYYEQGKIIRRPPVKRQRTYSVLVRSAHGLHFHGGDPYWPTQTDERGHTWQTQ